MIGDGPSTSMSGVVAEYDRMLLFSKIPCFVLLFHLVGFDYVTDDNQSI